jgi:hypothetical protein
VRGGRGDVGARPAGSRRNCVGSVVGPAAAARCVDASLSPKVGEGGPSPLVGPLARAVGEL